MNRLHYSVEMKTLTFPSFLWKFVFIAMVLIVWETIAQLQLFSSFIFPSISSTVVYAVNNHGRLLEATLSTLKLLLFGLSVSCVIALGVGALGSLRSKVKTMIETAVSILNPIPSISMLPFAILWFGLGDNPTMFITMISAFCPFLINVMNGFRTVNKNWLDVGRNYGLKGLGLVRHIILPASSPHLLAGFRTAWGASWRTVVAAELVFGAVGGKGGLGWLIYMNRFQLNAAGMLAALLCISLIGILAENILEVIERRTVKKWGMKT